MKFNQTLLVSNFASFAIAFVLGGLYTGSLSVTPEAVAGPEKKMAQSANGRSRYYNDKASFFAGHGRNDYDIVFIGDSITDGAEWEDLFPDQDIANRGVNGDTTDGMLERISSIVSTNADKAFIMAGINDLKKGAAVETVFNNYQTMVESLKDEGFDVYIQSTLLTGKRLERLNDQVLQLNSQLQSLAEQYDQVTFIDLNPALAPDGLLNTQYTFDDLHLSAEGYEVWRNNIKVYIAP